MALITCRECAQQFSSGAKACPHCGYRRTTGGTKLILWLIIIAVVAGAWNSCQQESAESDRRAAMSPAQRAAEDEARAKEKRLDMAQGACQAVLEKSLNDPDSAKFDSGWYTQERKDGTIVVQPSGRAKNGFGAYMHGVWECVARPDGDGMRVLSLKQLRP